MVTAWSALLDNNGLTVIIISFLLGISIILWLWEKIETRNMPKEWRERTSPKHLKRTLLLLEQSYPESEFHPFTRVLEWAEVRTTQLPRRQSLKIMRRFIDSMTKLTKKGEVEESSGPAYRVKRTKKPRRY